MPVEALWSADIPATALLTAIVVPLRPGLRLDYARDLRPIMTQAVALANDGPGRVVTATEYAVPCIRRIGGTNPDRVEGVLDLADPVTTTAYLRRASAALLARQLDRMKTS